MSKENEVITVKAECDSCDGTGLFISAYCHDGAAVLCRKCNGEGYREITYKPFVSRKQREKKVIRVFQPLAFQHFYPKEHTFTDGQTIDYSQYGCTMRNG